MCATLTHSTPADINFALYFDEALQRPTPYDGNGDYFRKARPRIDRTVELIEPWLKGAHVLDIGASPFYLLDRALMKGAARASGLYFAYDDHPLRDSDRIYSRHGSIGLFHSNIETDPLPFADDSVDVLTACEILEHCDYFPALLAQEIRRTLRPGGLLCLTVPNVASVAHIAKLLMGRNIYMRYRADPTGRHKHEYTMAQLRDFVDYLGLEPLAAGYMPFVTSAAGWTHKAYKAVSLTPGLKRWSPKLYILARQPSPKPTGPLGHPPASLYDDGLSIED